ncbi:hypothetical protein RclHR1_15900001 [Rhizophagus clarus]|uniref:Uncharacterized protein n=1 Tax=Rhizophagus clarus TaxID=94130 RepID=A0A2Z6QHY9_9GLOM|nr:hypothetical protein RclHR1_15900001 [Rhizophagus clarus]
MRPWTSFQRSGTPLEVDYDILKVQNSLETDWYFEDSKLFRGLKLFRGGPVFQSLELFRGRPNLEADWDFKGSELQFKVDQVILKIQNLLSKWTIIFEGLDLSFNSLSQRAMIFEELDSLSQQTIKVRNFNLKWTRIFRRSGFSNSKQTRLEPYFETDQICSFRIPSGLNFKGSQIFGSFLKHNFEVRSDSIFAFCHFIGSKKLKVVCWNQTN